ncbi:Alkaline ceramidase domain protein [Rhodopirellula maiorica SM1]|uniref:Alkaline ceramidase domain protein n=1 Tax=Rhodopirellula maiorica SM1 TaxID=1265738 RepID=M5RNW1_9BACT|nr:neutral/alkaline non-lysosomal ceramidase N-terminal domain-containing protein [Rhodopirellula maiorica]EMI21018.1 Alkaline ceramidase domain protein [Rhodopirellula maiorica SM1]
MNTNEPRRFQHASFAGRIGIARIDITPPVGVYSRNWGAAKHDVADSIHRPLSLTALALSSSEDQPPLVLIDADLGWWKTPATFTAFQQRLQEQLSLEPDQLIFALTHTHAGPPLMQADDSLPGSDLLQQWMTSLVDQTVAAVRQACGTMFAARLEWHMGTCTLATVRDLPDPDPEKDRYLCGYDPDGEPDDTLVLGRITDELGAIRGTLVNYACHPTTLAAENTAISPDYVGAMRETIESVTSAPAMFLLGMCGDLAPRYQYVGDPEVADRHGRQLGFAALATLNDMEPSGRSLAFSHALESGAPLAIWEYQPIKAPTVLRTLRSTVTLPLKDWPSADELERQRLKCTDRALEERLRRRRDIRRGIGDGQTFDLPIVAWQLGDAVLVGSCCEPYSYLQQELRRRFKDRTLICMNLINGSIGYLPPADLYDADVYPVWQTPFGRGCLETTLEAMTGVINDVLSR